VGEPRLRQALAPQRRRPAGDLLQRDEVGADRVDGRRLLVEARDAPGDVPGEKAGQV
jgi:hypothetical protein